MAKSAVDLDDLVMVFLSFPTCACLCVMVKQINFKLPLTLLFDIIIMPDRVTSSESKSTSILS